MLDTQMSGFTPDLHAQKLWALTHRPDDPDGLKSELQLLSAEQ